MHRACAPPLPGGCVMCVGGGGLLTPPHNPQNGVPGYGGGGSKFKIFHYGIILCPKMIILQGVGHPMP